MIQFCYYSIKNYFPRRKLLKHKSIWNLNFMQSSSSNSSSDKSSNRKTNNHRNLKNSVKDQKTNLKFQNVLNYLEKSIPLFIGDIEEECKEFASALTLVKNLDSNEFIQEIDKIITQNKFDYQKFLRDKYLQSRSSILSDGSISCLLYPDLDLWNKTLPKQFLLDFMVANILSILDYLNDDLNNLIYSRLPSLGHDFIQRIDSEEKKNTNYIVISYSWNFYFIDLDLFENRYLTLWQIFKFLFEQTIVKNPHPMGILSTLSRNDCMYGYKFLNETDLMKLRKSKLLISLDKIDTLDSNINHDQRIGLMAKHILLSNKDNIGNRWFDKSLQLIFVLNKNVNQLYAQGICFEQSHVKIGSILDLMHHSIKFLMKFKPIESKLIKDIQFKKLQLFDLKSKRLTELINQATNNFAMQKYISITERFNVGMFQFNDYGLEMIENKFHTTPENLIQIAVNLTMYKLTQQCRPCYQRYFNQQNDEEIWLQCFNQELLDYIMDSNNRKKLLIALKSLKFHQEMQIPLAHLSNDDDQKSVFNIETNLLVYQNLLKSYGDLSKNYPNEVNYFDNFFKSKSLKRLRRSTIQVTILKPSDNYYDWHLVTNGHPYYDHRINITAHVAKNRIHFILSILRNDQLGLSIDRMKYELDAALNQIKNVLQI